MTHPSSGCGAGGPLPPAAIGVSERAEADALQKGAVAVVVRAAVVEVSEVEPVGGLADQPAMPRRWLGRLAVQVCDVGEAVLGDEAAGVAALLDLSR